MSSMNIGAGIPTMKEFLGMNSEQRKEMFSGIEVTKGIIKEEQEHSGFSDAKALAEENLKNLKQDIEAEVWPQFAEEYLHELKQEDKEATDKNLEAQRHFYRCTRAD